MLIDAAVRSAKHPTIWVSGFMEGLAVAGCASPRETTRSERERDKRAERSTPTDGGSKRSIAAPKVPPSALLDILLLFVISMICKMKPKSSRRLVN